MAEHEVNQVITNSDAVWIMYCAEDSDPYFKKFITDKTIVAAVALVTRKKTVLIAHLLDADNLLEFDGETIFYGKGTSLEYCIKNCLKDLGNPSSIYLNYSDTMDTTTDVLGFGIYQFIHKLICEYYKIFDKQPQILSAEPILYELIEKKSNEDLKYMKISAQRGLQIIEDVFKNVKLNMTEREIADLFHEIFEQKPQYFEEYGIVNEEFSWEKQSCPIVLIGDNLKKGGHTCPSDKKLSAGDTIYFDFGVTLTPTNGKKYASDLQRMGYALKPNEKDAPKEVKQVFNTLVAAISEGIKSCTPKMRGYEVDEIVRGHILGSGYPDYDHSTGHPVGETAHAPGASIAPKGKKRSNLFLKNSGVYTIEPRIQIKNGGSIEEMVVVTENGGQTLCDSQKYLYLI